MKKLITLFTLTLLFVGTSFAQISDSDPHTVSVTINDYAEIDVDQDVNLNYDYITNTVTGNGTPTAVVNGGLATVVAFHAATLTWNTNLTNMKITAEQTPNTGFQFNEVRASAGPINPNPYTVTNAGVPVSPAPVLTGTATNFINNIWKGGGTAPLTYSLEFPIFESGTGTINVTYTLTSN